MNDFTPICDRRLVAISGASSGIGLATALRFAGAGFEVLNLDLRPPEQACPQIRYVECDVTDWTALGEVLAEYDQHQGPLHCAIANAGISLRRSILNVTRDEVVRLLDLNLTAVIGMWQAAARLMMVHGRGVLLATASTNGIVGYPFYSDYNASKAGSFHCVKALQWNLPQS